MQTKDEQREERNKAKLPGSTITTSNGRRLVKMDRDSPKWDQEAYSLLASSYGIKSCGECGHPVLPGYCCGTCGSSAP